MCGNCVKTGSECVYDPSSQKREDAHDGSTRSGHGIKRRRGTPRRWEEDIDELQAIYGDLKQAESSPGQKPDSHAIEARLDKLMSMIERLDGASPALEASERHAGIPIPAVETSLPGKLRPTQPRNGIHISSRPSSPRRAGGESSGDEFPIPSGQATDLVDPVGGLNLGHLSLDDGGRSR